MSTQGFIRFSAFLHHFQMFSDESSDLDDVTKIVEAFFGTSGVNRSRNSDPFQLFTSKVVTLYGKIYSAYVSLCWICFFMAIFPACCT